MIKKLKYKTESGMTLDFTNLDMIEGIKFLYIGLSESKKQEALSEFRKILNEESTK